LPNEDAAYSVRWAWIKKEFTQRWLARGGVERRISDARRARGRRGVWQPRFWEHTIRDEKDFEAHLHYIHYNPVKHGLVEAPKQWAHSSLHRWVRAGIYPPDWCCTPGVVPQCKNVDGSVGE
jgi:putative transposase